MDCIMLRRDVTVLFTPWKTPQQIWNFENIMQSTSTVLHGGKAQWGEVSRGSKLAFCLVFYVPLEPSESTVEPCECTVEPCESTVQDFQGYHKK